MMRLVLIEWEDSHLTAGWQHLGAEIEDRALICRSVGWLLLDGEHAKVVAPHLNESEPGVPLQGSGVVTIPSRAVLSIVELATSPAAAGTATTRTKLPPAPCSPTHS